MLFGAKKNFGFGLMRLPLVEGTDEIDFEQVNKMVDTFMESGFNYFDSARVYHAGRSEVAVRKCLAERYPRESYVYTNKLSTECFTNEEEIDPLFEDQLKVCGMEYFDCYLLHCQTATSYAKYKKVHAYEHVQKFKEQGRIKHIGISFHDKAELLDTILSEHPEIEVVQLQINYLDWESASVESRKCYEVCVKYNKPVIVMEPVKGGSLANVPADAGKLFSELSDATPASYAIRFAAGHENVVMTLSGMSNYDQLLDNIATMKDYKPLDEKELDTVWKVRDIILSLNAIPCTACRYCVEGCPMGIRIPDLFNCYNQHVAYNSGNQSFWYGIITSTSGKASDCVKCGACEASCPQHLPIRKLLEDVAERFGK